MIEAKKCIYLFDRGYYNYSWYDNFTDYGFEFITRQSSNACVEEIRNTYVDNDFIFDYEITLGMNIPKIELSIPIEKFLPLMKMKKNLEF